MSETPPPPPPPDGSDPTQAYPQQSPPQPGYPQPGQQVPYGAPQWPAYGPVAPDHPQATTTLILGIVGIVACGIAAPFAWVMGNRVLGEIDASGGTLGGRSNANAGRICGIVGTVLLGLSLLFVVGLVIVAATATVTTSP